ASSCAVSSVVFTVTSPPVIDTLSLHDALPISWCRNGGSRAGRRCACCWHFPSSPGRRGHFIGPRCVTCATVRSAWTHWCRWALRSEEHTSELQSRFDLVCRLLLEKKKNSTNYT